MEEGAQIIPPGLLPDNHQKEVKSGFRGGSPWLPLWMGKVSWVFQVCLKVLGSLPLTKKTPT
jgi:hypothetical protein